MKILKPIPKAILQGVSTMLSAFVPEIDENNIMDAIRMFNTPKQEEHKGKSAALTKKQACEILNVSLSTLNRYVSAGKLRAIRLSRKSVRIDGKSIENLLFTGGQE